MCPLGGTYLNFPSQQYQGETVIAILKTSKPGLGAVEPLGQDHRASMSCGSSNWGRHSPNPCAPVSLSASKKAQVDMLKHLKPLSSSSPKANPLWSSFLLHHVFTFFLRKENAAFQTPSGGGVGVRGLLKPWGRISFLPLAPPHSGALTLAQL